jgi:hypothetical protein
MAIKVAPKFESEEEAAKFWLEHDTSEYGDWSKAERPNAKSANHLVPVVIGQDEYSELTELAADRKTTLAETITQLIRRGLKDFRANPSAPL